MDDPRYHEARVPTDVPCKADTGAGLWRGEQDPAAPDPPAAPPGESAPPHDRRDQVRNWIDGGGPRMMLQPIMDLGTGRGVGAEALARFPGFPQRSPDEWFTDAFAAGLGVEMELSAIEAALTLLPQFPCSTYLSVNASPETVMSDSLYELVNTASTDRVVLELTEHVEVADYEALAAPLNRLRWRGVRLAVDDVGSGYASLQHILNIAPDIIKLDAALIRDIDTDRARSSLAAALRLFAEQTGAAVIAEGIQNEKEHAAVLDAGIRYGQGYYYGHPVPGLPDAIRGLLATR